MYVSYAANPKDPGPAEEIKSSIASADDAIAKVYISDAYKTTNPKFIPNTKLTDKELDAIEAFIDGPGDPKKKSIYITRYGNDSERSADLMIKAKKKGFAHVIYISDANQYLNGTFQPEEKFLTDFSKRTSFKPENDMAAVIQKLHASGFKFNDPKYGTYSQPLFNKQEDMMIPIMHEKALLMRDENITKKQFRYFVSTANWTNTHRYNRLYDVADQDAAEYYLLHLQDMMKTFAKGGQIKDIPERSTRKINYKDGSYIEVAYTDGKYNPNDRITKELASALDPANKVKIKDITYSHFVLTKKDQVDTLEQVMAKDPKVTVQGVFDSKFVDLDGFGMSARLKGYDIYRKFGGSVEGIASQNITDRANIYVYQSPAIDFKTGKIRIETTREGPPRARKVWHDKTTVINSEVNGKPKSSIYTGSLNNSAHFDNAEVQFKIFTDADSLLAKGTVESVIDVAKLQTDFAIDMVTAVTRDSIAGITGHSELEVPVKRAKIVNAAILKRDYDTVIQELQAQATEKSNISSRPSEVQIQERIQRTKNFLTWYKENVPSTVDPIQDLRIRKLNSIALMISQDKAKWEYIEESIRSVIERPNLKSDQVEKLVRQAWVAFGMKGIPPTQRIRPTISFAFDWDDNVIKMPTKIRVFAKNGKTVKELTTAEYAKVRNDIGKKSPWDKYELREGAKGSFENFHSTPGGENHFLNDLMATMKTSAKDWQAPAWKSFVEALDDPDTAKNVSIITAREHTPNDILAGLEYLKQKELIKNLPDLKNIHAVGASKNPSLEKVKIMKKQLTEIDKTAIAKDTYWVADREGSSSKQMHVWGFSDDDFGNYSTALKELSAEVKSGKYPNVKISLFYTGTDSAHKGPFSVIIKDDGTTRAMTEAELLEVPRMMPSPRKPCSQMYHYLGAVIELKFTHIQKLIAA